jgi:glycosyl transferase family 2
VSRREGEAPGPGGGSCPAVSVVIPTYQRRDLVRGAVESVLAQSFPDFEVIVVDDGSTDGTGEALDGLDGRVRYHRRPQGGVASARNLGIRLTRGDIVAFLDSDNSWLPDHLAVLTEMLAGHPEAIAASTCPDFHVKGRKPVDAARVVDLLPELTIGTRVGYLSCVAVRRTVLLEVGGFDEQLPVYEDSDLFLRLALRGPFCLLGRRTIVHRTTRGGLRESGIRRGQYLDAMEASATSAVKALVEGLERTDEAQLRASLEARLMLVRGVRAALGGRPDEARAAFEKACRLRDDLSRRPGLVLGHVRYALEGAHVLVDAMPATARAWPDARSDTARFLYLASAFLAFHRGRRREAAAYLAHARLARDPLVLVRTRRTTARLVRERLRAGRGERVPRPPGRAAKAVRQ